MAPEDIPDELMDIVNKAAGREHSKTGTVGRTLALVLTRYDELRDRPATRRARSADVARAVGLSASTVQRYARQGMIPFTQTPGGQRRFSIEEVKAALSREVADG